MRYKILNGEVKESFFIDAPYDTKQDALDDLNSGVKHKCEYCDGLLDECRLVDKLLAGSL